MGHMTCLVWLSDRWALLDECGRVLLLSGGEVWTFLSQFSLLLLFRCLLRRFLLSDLLLLDHAKLRVQREARIAQRDPFSCHLGLDLRRTLDLAHDLHKLAKVDRAVAN